MNRPPEAGSRPIATMGSTLINRAERLARYCAGFLRDEHDRRGGWDVFCAVDADIVGLYLNPAGRSNYADVFDGGDALLARLIGDFLVLQFQSGLSPPERVPLFVIPPHDEQITRMLMRITEKHVEAMEGADFGLDALVAYHSRSPAEEMDKASDWLLDSARELVEIFDGQSGPALELSRFAAIADDRIVNIETHVGGAARDWAFPLPNSTDDLLDLDATAQILEKWQRNLSKHRSRKQQGYSVDEDALVLTSLQWINQQLEGQKKRLVLITGTSGIWAAAAEEDCRVESGRHKGMLFCDAYIRHPQAFLADRHFFFEQEPHSTEPTFNLVDWLNLVFPNVLRFSSTGIALADVDQLSASPSLGAARSATRSQVAADSNGQLHDAEAIISEWKRQVGAAAIVRQVQVSKSHWNDRAKAVLDWIREKTNEGWTLDQLHSDIGKRAVKSLSVLYSSTVWLGLWARLRRLPDLARGLPSLRFEPPYEMAHQYYKLVVSAVYGDEDTRKPAALIDLRTIYADLSEVDPSHYLSHVIHALAYASKGHWYATRTLCRVALRIADDLSDEERGSLRGREAAYLLAIAERRMARSLDDIDSARAYLEQATIRQDPDQSPDMRFESEALSQAAASFNFRFFVNKDAEGAISRLGDFHQTGLDLLESLNGEALPEARDWISQQVVTNLLDVAIALASLPSTRSVEPVLKVLDYVQRSPRVRQTIAADGVAEFVFTTAIAVFSQDATERSNAAARLSGLQFPSSRPYDSERKALFGQMATRH